MDDPRKATRFPTLSVLIPAWNEGETIADTIRAVLDSDYPQDKIEIIAINDGSTDNTLAEMKKFGNKIKIFDKPNSGKADSMNQAMKLAKHEYLAVIDADSYPVKNALRDMVAYLEEKDVVAVTSAILVKNRKKLIEKMQAIEYAVIAWSRKLLQYIEGIYVAPGPLSIYHKKSFISYGGFDTNNLTEDIEATWKILSHNKKVRIDLRAKVYTTAPSKFRVWWKQRLRWNLGGFQTMWKYKKLFFNPSYGMMGLFVVPFFIFTFALSLLGFMVFAFVLVRNLTKTYLLSSYAGAADTGFLRLDYLNFNPNVFAFFAAILVFLGLLYLVFSQRYIEKTKILPRSYPIFAIYLLIYLTLYPLVLIHTLYRMISGKKLRW
jgi:cellulose synthase/poly-beta-1,6-N-acetylglucosamine synthase-like glycosyltransferase